MKNKNGIVARLYRRNMRNLIIVFLLALTLCVYHFVTSFNYMRNYISSGYELNLDNLVQTAGTREVEYTTQTAKEKGFEVATTEMFNKQYVYYQDNDYRFKLIPDKIEETDLYYSSALKVVDPTYQGEGQEYMLQRCLIITVGDYKIVAIAPYDYTVPEGEPLRVTIAQIPEYIANDIGLKLSEGEGLQILNYYVDLTQLPVEYEDEDWTYMIFYSIVTLALLALVIIFIVKPQFHPIYLQLKKYNDDIEDTIAAIDGEYAAGVDITRVKKETIMPTWIIKRSMFMNIINKNHKAMAQGEKERIERTRGKSRYQ